jgi:hypothetical protein
MRRRRKSKKKNTYTHIYIYIQMGRRTIQNMHVNSHLDLLDAVKGENGHVSGVPSGKLDKSATLA